jgi:hypothetical protein
MIAHDLGIHPTSEDGICPFINRLSGFNNIISDLVVPMFPNRNECDIGGINMRQKSTIW